MSVHSYRAFRASRKPLVTRSVPGRDPQSVIGRLPFTLGLRVRWASGLRISRESPS
jgi:hypothetical protein